MSETSQKVMITHAMEVDGKPVATLAAGNEDFFLSNKKTTTDYRVLYAHAIGTTGTIEKITKMSFGTGGEIDDQGNPAPPANNGPLNMAVLTVDIKSVSYPVETTVSFEAEIPIGTVTAAINEVALITENGITAARQRLLTSKGTDAESGLNFRWNMEF